MADTSGTNWSGSEGEEPVDTNAEIMWAVYRALSKNGYPELTMSQIAAEFEKSKGLLYYHYDSKEAILNDFFTHLCERLETSLVDDEYDDPAEQLWAVIERILPAAMDDEQLEFRQAFFLRLGHRHHTIAPITNKSGGLTISLSRHSRKRLRGVSTLASSLTSPLRIMQNCSFRCSMAA